jgi:predicted DNA-binding transcriptional regulator YafY
VDIAIEEGKQLQYDYNKYGLDKQLHKSSFQRVTPYQLILHNQRYYLMGYSTYWKNMVFHRLDRLSNVRLYDKPAQPIREIPGFESGIDYKKIASTLPYMYTDDPERIEFATEPWMVDQVIDWFGKDIAVRQTEDPDKVIVSLWASPYAMEHWAMQYLNYVEVIAPIHLRVRIRENVENGLKKYC